LFWESRADIAMTSPTQGWILLCNNSTQDEYLQKGLVGLKEQYLPRLHSLQEGDPVLLYNFESSQLVAFLFDTGRPAMDIMAEGWFKRYRAQVPVRLELQFEPPIGRENLRRSRTSTSINGTTWSTLLFRLGRFKHLGVKSLPSRQQRRNILEVKFRDLTKSVFWHVAGR